MSSNPLKQISYTVANKKIAALTNNNNKAPVLLCLHGWLDNAASFYPLQPYLETFNVIAIDWPGHGLSDHRSADAFYHFLDWVYDLLALFKSQQWQKINIVGHSMGGMIASAFSAAFPEHVKTLTLIDAIGLISAPGKESSQQLRKGTLSRLKQQEKNKTYHQTIDSAIQARMKVSDLTQENATLLVERGIKKTAKGYLWRSDNSLRSISPYRLTPTQSEQLISDIKAPVQLIYGSKGLVFIKEGLKQSQHLFAKLQIHKLEGGHHVHMEQPQQTAELITQFIEENKT